MSKNYEENIENTEMEPMTDEELAFNEADILRALTAGDIHKSVTDKIVIDIPERNLRFAFHIRALTEQEYDKCRERNTRYQKNRRLGGMRLPESTNTPGYHSDLIYTATVDEDKAKLWDNKAFWSAAGALTGKDMVDKLIPLAGAKQEIIDRIERLSGFDADSEEEYGEAVKN